MSRYMLHASLLLLALVLGMELQRRVTVATSYGQHREPWDIAVAQWEAGLIVYPAQPNAGGYVELWVRTTGADDLRPVFQIPGAPATQTQPPAVRPPVIESFDM